MSCSGTTHYGYRKYVIARGVAMRGTYVAGGEGLAAAAMVVPVKLHAIVGTVSERIHPLSAVCQVISALPYCAMILQTYILPIDLR